MFDPLSVLAIFGPLLVDAGKAAVQKWMAPDDFKPATIEQYVQMRQLEIDMFKMINNAGGSNPTYMWVEAIIRLMRPVVAVGVIATWAVQKFYGIDDPSTTNFAAAIGFYLFGDRTLFYSRKK